MFDDRYFTTGMCETLVQHCHGDLFAVKLPPMSRITVDERKLVSHVRPTKPICCCPFLSGFFDMSGFFDSAYLKENYDDL